MNSETYKLVVLGAGGVGKSSLIIQFVRHMFCDEYDPTVEDAYYMQTDLDGEKIAVDILDTAGQEAFSAMRDQYIHNGEGFILAYSLKYKDSYMEIPTYHRQILRVKNDSSTPCVLVETMVDIIVADIWYAKHLVSQSDLAQSEEEEVPQGEGESLADQLHIPFIRTSAKLRINIEECFHTLLRRVRDFKELSRDERQGMRDKGHCVLL